MLPFCPQKLDVMQSPLMLHGSLNYNTKIMFYDLWCSKVSHMSRDPKNALRFFGFPIETEQKLIKKVDISVNLDMKKVTCFGKVQSFLNH